MLIARNHVLAMLAEQIPLATDQADFMVKLTPAPAPWRLPGHTAWPERLTLMLTADIFAPPTALEIIHAECTWDANPALHSIARGMEGTTARQWPKGTHVTSVITEAGLQDIRGPYAGTDTRWLDIRLGNYAKVLAGYTPPQVKRTEYGVVHVQANFDMPQRKATTIDNDRQWTLMTLPAGLEPPHPINFFATAKGLPGAAFTPLAMRIEGPRIILDDRRGTTEPMTVHFNQVYHL